MPSGACLPRPLKVAPVQPSCTAMKAWTAAGRQWRDGWSKLHRKALRSHVLFERWSGVTHQVHVERVCHRVRTDQPRCLLRKQRGVVSPVERFRRRPQVGARVVAEVGRIAADAHVRLDALGGCGLAIALHRQPAPPAVRVPSRGPVIPVVGLACGVVSKELTRHEICFWTSHPRRNRESC